MKQNQALAVIRITIFRNSDRKFGVKSILFSPSLSENSTMADTFSFPSVSPYASSFSGDVAGDLAREDPAQPAFSGEKKSGGDQVQISPSGRALAKKTPEAKKTDVNGLTPEQDEQVREMRETDQRVRLHEQAHIAAGGSLVHGGASYTFRTGPDGNRYAVAGEVNIDTSPEKDPDATIHKAARIRSAALAPADPSAQDRAVASSADKMALAAALQKMNLKSKK